ncbi:MAG: STAS domain-containing protein [Phycisphaerae bacterium]|nr:STAS domain-containing protein [Phycisphaerae bacterium]
MSGNPTTNLSIHETPFSMEVETRGDAAVAYLRGSCTMTVSAQLGVRMRDLGSAGHRLIVVDASQLDFIESSGLGGLIAGYLRARKHKGEMRLVNPTADIRKLLETTRLAQLFGIYPSVDAALQT